MGAGPADGERLAIAASDAGAAGRSIREKASGSGLPAKISFLMMA